MPGIAPAAKQQGQYVAATIKARLHAGETDRQEIHKELDEK